MIYCMSVACFSNVLEHCRTQYSLGISHDNVDSSKGKVVPVFN
jgi:hypothetical protein